MNIAANFVSLPFELREKIYHDYFKADGGYVYNAESDKLTTADNSPIELSLMYTCRSIANDTKYMPLAVNTIKFSTLYREDWRGLAGCFNFVSTYHHLISSDLAVRLAHFMTPDIYSQVEREFPAFVPQLKEALDQHDERLDSLSAQNPSSYVSNLSDLEFEDSSDEESYEDELDDEFADIGPGDPAQVSNWRSRGWGQSHNFVGRNLKAAMRFRHEFYSGFRRIHDRSDNGHPLRDRWSGGVWEIQAAISYCLRLMVEKEPAEFSNLVYGALPNWCGTYPAEDFLNMRFDLWAIPSRSEVSTVVNRFQANDAWELLDKWHYTPSRCYHEGSYLDDDAHFNLLHKPFGVRCREKIRFSAAAAAIRFLERLSSDQRVQIRSLILYEDLPSVNAASAHAQGLVPFFKENPLLRVERRVSIFGCLYDLTDNPSGAARILQLGRGGRSSVICKCFNAKLAAWLLDALAVAESGIPAGSFTFVLEAGPHADVCSDLFQRVVHRDIAWHKAFKACVDRGFVVLNAAMTAFTLSMLQVDEGLEGAIEHLLNETSVLRCDFNPGFAWNFEAVVDETKDCHGSDWLEACIHREPRSILALPATLNSKDRLADNFEIQTEDDYLQLQPDKEQGNPQMRSTSPLE
ncbi:hypothetical protein ACHAPJ_009883 [Fusarium lateritium]